MYNHIIFQGESTTRRKGGLVTRATEYFIRQLKKSFVKQLIAGKGAKFLEIKEL